MQTVYMKRFKAKELGYNNILNDKNQKFHIHLFMVGSGVVKRFRAFTEFINACMYSYHIFKMNKLTIFSVYPHNDGYAKKHRTENK